MFRRKIQKGEWGYLEQEKKRSTIVTVIMFVFAVGIFFIGYWIAGKKENMASVFAVLALLPASKAMVSMIMFLKTPKYEEQVHKTITACAGNVPVLYQMYLTSYQKNFPLSCIAVKGNNLMGYTEFEKCDVKSCEEHVEALLKQNRNKNVNVKIFTDLKKFEERMAQLQTQDAVAQDEDILSLMRDISL